MAEQEKQVMLEALEAKRRQREEEAHNQEKMLQQLQAPRHGLQMPWVKLSLMFGIDARQGSAAHHLSYFNN